MSGGWKLLGRLETCGDAVAAEARYHKKCYNYFMQNSRKDTVIPGVPQAENRGRLADVKMLR